MAWNPTPEVQVARDAAKALTKAGRFIDRIVLMFTTEQGQIGYMDCTEWELHESADEAARSLIENYLDGE